MSSAPESSRDCERLIDAGAYTLHALRDAEARSFEEHLEGCRACREEVTQLQVAVNALALGVPRIEAPPELGARIMAAIYPEADPLGIGGPAERGVPARSRRERRRSRRRGLIPALAATAALGAGLLIGALAINTPSSQRTEVIRAVVLAPGHRATATLRTVGGHVQLIVEGMPAPPAGRIYEVWLEHGTQEPAPTDVLFSVTTGGSGTVAVPGELRGISNVLVTDEPLGGSLKPTRKPIIVAKV